MTGLHRLGIRLVALAALLTAGGGPLADVAGAQGSGAAGPPAGLVRLQAHAGFDGHGRVGGWIPVVADVINESTVPFSGELRVDVRYNTSRGNFSAAGSVFTTPVSVPGRSHRRFALDVRIPTVATITQARLFSADGETVAEQEVPLLRVPLGELFCGVVGRDARGYQFLEALNLPPPLRRARVVPLAAPDLPSVGHLLGSFDCLIFDGANSAQLRPEQIEALQVWVNGGGLLLTVGGSSWRANLSPLPPSLLPVEPQSLTSVESFDSLAALVGEPQDQPGPWLVTRARLRPGMGSGRVLASEEGVPLVVAAKRGDGGVVYLAFDPTSSDLMKWSGQTALWRFLLSHASIDSGTGASLERPYLRWGRVPRWALTDYTEQPRPDASWLLLLSPLAALASALTVAGFGAARRPAQAALGVGGIGLVATITAFALASHRAEPDVRVNQISIIRPVSLGEAAYTRTYVAAWPHRSGAYTFQLPALALPFSLWYPSPRPGDESDAEWAVTVVESQRPQVKDLELPTSRLATFAVDGQLSSQQVRLEADLLLHDDNRVAGTVTNALDQPVEDLTLVVDTFTLPLGTLGAGQSVRVDTEVPERVAAGYRAAQSLPSELLGEPSAGEPPGVRRDVLSALFTQRFLARRAEVRGPTLIGWLPRDPVDMEVASGGNASIQRAAILIAPARIRLPVGYHGPVPPTLLTKRDLGGGAAFSPDRDYWTIAPGDSVNLQFSLPAVDGPWDVDELLVNLRMTPVYTRVNRDPLAEDPAEPSDPDRVSIFNWRQGEWQDWQLGAGTARIPEPRHFISATGDVRVRYDLDTSAARQFRQVYVTRLDITPIVRVEAG